MVHGEKLPAGVLALAEVGAGRRVIAYNRAEPRGAQRVGIAHEFGHLLLDLHDTSDFQTRECKRNIRSVLDDPHELAPEHVAGELLVPFVVLDRFAPAKLYPKGEEAADAFLDVIDQLSSRFGVTPSFIDWRLKDLILLRRSSLFTL